jgi:hypothetical protein
MHTYHLIPLITLRPRSKTFDLNATTHRVLIPLIMSWPRSKISDPNATTHSVFIPLIDNVKTKIQNNWSECGCTKGFEPLIMSRPKSKIIDPNRL